MEQKNHPSAFLHRAVSAVLAGLCISVGGIANLRVGGIAGAVLFTFGLLTVTHYKYALYTGTAGFVRDRQDCLNLLQILCFNAIGCLITGLVARGLYGDLAAPIVALRSTQDPLSVFGLAIFCGFIMTTAVAHARENRFLPLLFGVPLFILCGFIHSIADAFYLSAGGVFSSALLCNWLCAVAGNFVGCNLYRLLPPKAAGE